MTETKKKQPGTRSFFAPPDVREILDALPPRSRSQFIAEAVRLLAEQKKAQAKP